MPDDHVITRRRFLLNLARSSGAATAYAALDALGASSLALGAPPAYRGAPSLPAGLGRGVRITILGAGVAGLTCAYELQKAGFQCTLLEARKRRTCISMPGRRASRTIIRPCWATAANSGCRWKS